MSKGGSPGAKRLVIANGSQIPAEWGAPREAVRTTTVTIREPDGEESFAVSDGILVARSGLDWVIVQHSGKEYPIKKDIFRKIYEEVASGEYRKKARSRLVQVPAGVEVVLISLEGRIEVRHPDYIVIGTQNEVYANTAQWVSENLEFL